MLFCRRMRKVVDANLVSSLYHVACRKRLVTRIRPGHTMITEVFRRVLRCHTWRAIAKSESRTFFTFAES